DTANWNEAYGWGDHSAEGYLTAYNETDPVFNAHLTSDITTADTSNWNTAYTWGNHADEGYLTSYSETDPIFNAHLASNITATDTANWNEAHNWGDHSAEGYLTAYNETDPVFDAHLSSDITATDTANWNEAHSWGDHSAEGYLTAYNETDPVFDAHLTSDITGTDTANWNDAYGWGNHADEGYLTAYNETDPIFASHLSYGIMASDTANWNDAYGWGDHSSAGYLTSEVDGSVNNELQTINFLNDTLYLSDGGNIYLGEYKESLSDTINFGNNILRTSKIISGYDSSLLDSGLVAYYPFNGDPNDESGNDNNGNVNGASLTTDRFGNASSAYSFDGTDDYIDIPITDFELDKGSIILWFQIDGVNYGEQKFIFNISNNTNEIITEFVMKIDQRTGMVTQRLMSVMFIDDPDPRPWQIDVHENDFNSVTNFNWNCMAVVQDGTEIIMYLNGNSIGTLSFTNDVASWWNDLFNATNPSTVATIGALRRNGTTIGSFDGKIDDIRIYNRVLTQYEVQALYEGEAYGELTFYDPIAGDVSLSELKNNPGDFSNGGEAGGAVRTLGNIDNYGLGFLTSNDTSLYIDENGNVGIGTTNPKAHLQIGPRMTIISKSGYTNMYNNNAYVDYVVDDYRYLVDGYATQYQQSSAGEHVFRIAPSGTANTILSWAEVLRIKSTGNVGIGTTDPQNKLDVEGGTVIGASYSGTNTAPTNGLLVEGNVGIGVISPEKRLHVNGDIMINALEKFIAKFDNSGDEFRGNFGFDGIQFGNNNWNYIVAGNTYGGRLMFVVNNTTDLVDYNRYSYHNGIEAMGITTSGGIVIGPSFMGNNPGTGNMIITGNVGIGTTSSSGKLHVQGGTTDDADSAFVVTSDGNVGIGTLNPAYKMELASNKEHTAIRLRCNGASKTSDWSVSALTVSGPESSFAIHDNRENAYRLYIDSLGYTGINNYNPQYQLDVSGDIRIRSGGQLIFGDGSSMSTAGTGSASSLSNAGDAIVTGDSDANSSGGVLFKTGSNTRMTILNNGNVGIGETNPLNKLTVTAGSVTNYSGDLNDIVALVGTGNVDTWINYWRESTTERQGILWSEDSRGDRGVFEMNASGNWAFHSGGNFGINTMTPSSLFHVQGGTTDDADSTFVVTDSGKVGIGTTLPKGKLEIDLGETDGIGGLIISEQGFERFGLYGYYSGGGATGNYTVLKSSDAADIMTWQNGGNVGISTTSPGGLLGLKNTNTYLDVDGSNNLTFTDAVTGTKTLAELAANNSLWTEDTYGMHSNYTSLGVGIDSKTGSNNNLYIYDPDNFNHAELLLDGHNAGFIYLKSRRASREYFITNCWSDVTSDANIHIGLSGGGLGMIFNPSNNLGLGTETPQNKLDIEGGAVIGASYSGTNTAPTNGLLVEGNVGIGIINPNAKLDVNGSVRLNDSNIYFRSGSDINHGLGFYQNPKLFDNIDVNGPVLFGCDRGGVGTTGLVGERMSILWDWNGKVYIDPGNRNNGSISNYGLLFGQNSTEGIASKRTSGGNQYGLDFYTNSTNRLSITTTGNIGINKSSPSGLLHVQGGTTGSADSAFVVTSDGDVGIGISTPNAKLDILGPYNTTPGENQTLRINHVYGFRTSTLYSDTIFFECLESNIWYPVFSIPRGTRDVYFSDDVSALSFTDRTPYPIDLKTAYDAVLSMKRLPNGVYEEDNKENQLDHSALHPFIRSSDGEHRDLSATVSAQNEVIKDLIKRIEELEQQVKELEGK
ncbi:MAG: hypothetical protein JXB49_17325, partial [Bacteroidales bacterium]|nr:hypothetical protein [Bacteroidales bacterium]